MDVKLFLTKLEAAEEITIPKKAHSIEVGTVDVSYFTEDGTYIKCEWFENEQIGYDTYVHQYDETVTVAEFLKYKEENPNALSDYFNEVQDSMIQLDAITREIESLVEQGVKIANKHCIPFQFSANGGTVDVRRVASVDWDSSSMYC